MAGIVITDRELAYTVCVSDLQGVTWQWKTEVLGLIVAAWLVSAAIWAGIWVAVTVIWVRVELRREALLDWNAIDPAAAGTSE